MSLWEFQATNPPLCMPEYRLLSLNLHGFFKTGSRSRYVKDFLKRLRLQGFLYSITGPNMSCSSNMRLLSNGGLAVISKYPIISYDKEEFVSKRQGIENFVHNGFLYCRIMVQQGKDQQFVQVLNTQLQSETRCRSDKQRMQQQLIVFKQCQQIATFLRYNAEPNETMFITGDFGINAIAGVHPKNITLDSLNNVLKIFDKNSKEDQKPNIGLQSSKAYQQVFNHLDIFGDKQNMTHNVMEKAENYMENAKNPTMNLVDLTKFFLGGHPITLGDIYIENDHIMPKETLLTAKNDLKTCQCADFVFTYDNVVANIQKVTCQPLISTSPYIQQLSDHAAIAVEFSLYEKSECSLRVRK